MLFRPAKTVAVLLALIVLYLLASCAHRPAYRDPLFFETLGRDTEMMVTMRTDEVRDMIVYAFPDLGSEDMDHLFDRAERVSVATQTAPGDHATGVYGGIEGDIPKLLTRLGLTFSSQWERSCDGYVYFTDDFSGFEISVPKRGILVFADRNLSEVYTGMTRDRVVYVPRQLTDRFIDADAALYSSNPDGMNLFGEKAPFPFELFFDEMWLTVNRVDQVVPLDDTQQNRQLYHVEGIITLPQNVQARVFDRIIRIMYQDYMRKRDMEVENWRVRVNLKENTVVFDNLLIYDDIIQEVFRIAAAR